MYVSYEDCVLTSRGHSDGPITRPEDSYQVCSECDCLKSIMRRSRPTRSVKP